MGDDTVTESSSSQKSIPWQAGMDKRLSYRFSRHFSDFIVNRAADPGHGTSVPTGRRTVVSEAKAEARAEAKAVRKGSDAKMPRGVVTAAEEYLASPEKPKGRATVVKVSAEEREKGGRLKQTMDGHNSTKPQDPAALRTNSDMMVLYECLVLVAVSKGALGQQQQQQQQQQQASRPKTSLLPTWAGGSGVGRSSDIHAAPTETTPASALKLVMSVYGMNPDSPQHAAVLSRVAGYLRSEGQQQQEQQQQQQQNSQQESQLESSRMQQSLGQSQGQQQAPRDHRSEGTLLSAPAAHLPGGSRSSSSSLAHVKSSGSPAAAAGEPSPAAASGLQEDPASSPASADASRPLAPGFAVLIDPHKSYVDLLRLLLVYESRGHSDFVPLSIVSKWLLASYAERFNVRLFFRHLVYLRLLMRYFDPHSPMFLMISGSTISELVSLEDSGCVPDAIELELYDDTMSIVHKRVRRSLVRYRTQEFNSHTKKMNHTSQNICIFFAHTLYMYSFRV
jgi:hypothetical protein